MELFEKIELMRDTSAQIESHLSTILDRERRLYDMKTGKVRYYNIFANEGELEKDIEMIEKEKDLLKSIINEKIKQLETLKF